MRRIICGGKGRGLNCLQGIANDVAGFKMCILDLIEMKIKSATIIPRSQREDCHKTGYNAHICKGDSEIVDFRLNCTRFYSPVDPIIANRYPGWLRSVIQPWRLRIFSAN